MNAKKSTDKFWMYITTLWIDRNYSISLTYIFSIGRKVMLIPLFLSIYSNALLCGSYKKWIQYCLILLKPTEHRFLTHSLQLGHSNFKILCKTKKWLWLIYFIKKVLIRCILEVITDKFQTSMFPFHHFSALDGIILRVRAKFSSYFKLWPNSNTTFQLLITVWKSWEECCSHH